MRECCRRPQRRVLQFPLRHLPRHRRSTTGHGKVRRTAMMGGRLLPGTSRPLQRQHDHVLAIHCRRRAPRCLPNRNRQLSRKLRLRHPALRLPLRLLRLRPRHIQQTTPATDHLARRSQDASSVPVLRMMCLTVTCRGLSAGAKTLVTTHLACSGVRVVAKQVTLSNQGTALVMSMAQRRDFLAHPLRRAAVGGRRAYSLSARRSGLPGGLYRG